MKKLLLFAILTSFLAVNAQQQKKDFKSASPHYQTANYCDKTVTSEKILAPGETFPQTFSSLKEQNDNRSINPIAIGQAGNAYGFAYTRNTFLWADNNINSITFMHRMTASPGTGYLAYDMSQDGGLSWQNNIQTYNPTLPGGVDARYPQGAIYNPVGNTDPDNAYFHFFAPTLDGSNTGGGNNWGGYAYGVKKLEAGAVPTMHNRTSTPPYYQYLPSAFTITQTGDAWMVDENSQGNSTTFDYLGDLILGHGVWDTELEDYNYSFSLFPLEINSEDVINDTKIAFAPDGLTGYICIMSERPDPLPYTSYHPILLKTTDGGETWSDPIEVQLGGDDGLEEVRQYIADSMLVAYFDPEPVPPREEIPYFMGYDIDLSVDAWGNPHIVGMVLITDLEAGLIYYSEGLIAMFHIWSEDQGLTWDAFNLGYCKKFKAEFGTGDNTMSMYNRPQSATTQDGAIVFFSWLDTESSEATDNSQPDIFFREYLPTTGEHGENAENVTTFSAAMWAAFYGCMSHYVFAQVTDNEFVYTCTIPFVYEQMGTGNDPQLPVQFFYIPDFIKSYTITDIGEYGTDPSVIVSQNKPNPFSSNTTITVNLLRDSDLMLKVYNLTGSLVKQIDFGTMNKGVHDLKFSADGLSQGVYFYSIDTGNGKITKKMIIK